MHTSHFMQFSCPCIWRNLPMASQLTLDKSKCFLLIYKPISLGSALPIPSSAQATLILTSGFCTCCSFCLKCFLKIFACLTHFIWVSAQMKLSQEDFFFSTLNVIVPFVPAPWRLSWLFYLWPNPELSAKDAGEKNKMPSSWACQPKQQGALKQSLSLTFTFQISSN